MYKKFRFGRIFVRVQYIVDPHNQNLVRVRTPGPSQDRRHCWHGWAMIADRRYCFTFRLQAFVFPPIASFPTD